jgi:hypothetical protein
MARRERQAGKVRINQQINAPAQQVAGRNIINKAQVVVHQYIVIAQDRACHAREAAVRALVNRWLWACNCSHPHPLR